MRPITAQRYTALGIAALLIVCVCTHSLEAADPDGFADEFSVPREALASTGKGDYLVLEPNFQLVYESAKQGEQSVRLITSVLPKTETIDGVETRVVESVEFAGDQPRKVTRNYLAIHPATRDVYCFGRSVDRYDRWMVTGSGGGWRSGVNGARYGLWMPGKPQAGQKFYEVLAPKVAMDRAEVASLIENVRVPAARFSECLKMVETTPLSPKRKTERLYAPGVGLLMDGNFKLVRYGVGVEPLPDPEQMAAKLKQKAKDRGEPTEPLVPHDLARAALAGVGADPAAEHVWMTAINDPALSAHQRSDLIEDLNESGFEDPSHVRPDELPLVLSRLAIIEELAPFAMDDVNADAFAEAHKDLVNIASKLTQ
jgi:hypothetical protein